MIQISKNLEIDALDYAVQGNAILGIRESGKSYTGTKISEQLMDNNICIVAFDPVGIWRSLKIGLDGNPGYNIVVAGGDETCDIIINKDNCVDIMDACMKESINLVVDFYSAELSIKALWIQIAERMVEHLMYNNKNYSVRHIFLEEAAEMIPQKPQSQHARMYAAMEKIARMGRNAHLGYTLINQRAEEVNKAILEITALIFLHRQNGKNSLISIKTWLGLMQVQNIAPILKSLPTLAKGECWVVGQENQPLKLHVLPKKTYHPDPKRMLKEGAGSLPKGASVINVEGFVAKLQELLAAKNKQPVEKDKAQLTEQELAYYEINQDIKAKNEQLCVRVDELYTQNSNLHDELDNVNAQLQATQLTHARAMSLLESIKGNIEVNLPTLMSPQAVTWNEGGNITQSTITERQLANTVKISDIMGRGAHYEDVMDIPPDEDYKDGGPVEPTYRPKRYDKETTDSSANISKCARQILLFLNIHKTRTFSLPQVSVASGYSIKSSGFAKGISELNTRGLITKSSGRLSVNKNELEQVKDALGKDFDIKRRYSPLEFVNKLGACERALYSYLIKDSSGKFYTKDHLANATNYSVTSSGFSKGVSILNTMELIEKQDGKIRVNQELFNL